ncbi:MAG TPA: aminotransferase class V-fold PLP-dependent enzyme, partial [Pedobacter sp.]
MLSRRAILKQLTLAPLAGGVLSTIPFTSVLAAPSKNVPRDIFRELGVRTFINAAGTFTAMSGSLMRSPVVEVIMDSSHDFCMLDELQDKVGERIAKMVHSESAVVTAGAFSALTLGLAGILTGTDPDKVPLLPQIEGTGLRSEVITQKAHMIGYSHAFANTGCKMVYVETAEELEKAVSEKTALMHFLHIQSDKGKIQHEEWIAIAKKHNIPASIDIAADVPPVSNLWKFNDMGFDFVALSGGKAMRGPQSAGLLMGKKEIIAGARMHMPPRGENIGRGMKVN